MKWAWRGSAGQRPITGPDGASDDGWVCFGGREGEIREGHEGSDPNRCLGAPISARSERSSGLAVPVQNCVV